MRTIPQETIQLFQKEIFDWYSEHMRDLPWRHTHDPYAILVSEVMSQQTQIPRVIEKYLAWMSVFPDVFSLALADTKSVLQMWSGLGYNRRALYLKKCAIELVNKYGGAFPENISELTALPGIGVYTASAILCFAFNKQIPVIDTNITKVIAVKFCNGIVPDKKELTEIAEAILPIGRAYEWNQALMDYAAVVLKDKKIQIPKQTAFKGSDRYFRGKVLKTLLVKDRQTTQSIYAAITEEFPLDEDRFKKIIDTLTNDGFIEHFSDDVLSIGNR